jgi:hypothetical protein
LCERRKRRRRGALEGACTGAATITHPSNSTDIEVDPRRRRRRRRRRISYSMIL